MSDYTHLIGAEQVQRAGHSIQDAAERIERAVSNFGEHVDRLVRAMEQDAVERAQAREAEKRA